MLTHKPFEDLKDKIKLKAINTVCHNVEVKDIYGDDRDYIEIPYMKALGGKEK